MESSWSHWSIVAVTPVLASILAIIIRSVKSSNDLPLPSGPPPKPLLGNLTDFPRDNYVKVFSAWKEKYGNIVYLNLLGKSTLILNSRKAIDDLLVSRASNYQSRPSMIMGMKLSGWEWSLAFRQAGSEHSDGRKVLLSGLGPSGVKQWVPIIEKATTDLMHRFAEAEKSDILAITKDYMAKLILHIAYGERINQEHGIELMEANRRGVELSNVILSTFWLVDIFPFLQYLPRWFPGAGFLQVAEENRKCAHKMRDWPFELAVGELRQGHVATSLTTQSLENGHKPESVRDASGVLYAAGLDTTWITLSSFLTAMIFYPEAQRRAQQEIDGFIQTETRLPDSRDRNSLPYINALIKEILRWNPPVPLAVAHVNEAKDKYEGRRIPGGSTIFPNIWLAMHDTETWTDPEVFRPERFMDSAKDTSPDPAQYVFGFGKRLCPGKHLAERILHLVIVQTLALFTIELAPVMDRPSKVEFSTGFLSYPQVPKMRLTVRNKTMFPSH